MRSFAFCHAAKACSDASIISMPVRERALHKPANSWMKIRADRRKKYLEVPCYIKSESKISSICIEFPEVDEVYNSSVWKFISKDVSDNIIRKNIYAQSRQQERLVSIDDAVKNIVNGSSAVLGNDLNYIATLICCLRVKLSSNELFIQVCAALAKHLLLLISKPQKKMLGQIIWKYSYKQFIKMHLYNKNELIRFNEETWQFVEDYYGMMLIGVKQDMFVNFMYRLPSEEFRIELITDLVKAVTSLNIDSELFGADHYIHKVKLNKWPITGKAKNIGIIRT